MRQGELELFHETMDPKGREHDLMTSMRRMDQRIGRVADANNLWAKRVRMLEDGGDGDRELSSSDGEMKGWKWHNGRGGWMSDTEQTRGNENGKSREKEVERRTGEHHGGGLARRTRGETFMALVTLGRDAEGVAEMHVQQQLSGSFM